MDTKVKTLITLLVAVTFVSIGIAYWQHLGLDGVLGAMGAAP